METDSLPNKFLQYRNLCWIGGAIATILLCLYGLSIGRESFHHAYLIGFLFVLAPTLGSMALLGVVHMTTGRWGFCIQRVLEAAMNNMIWVALMFVPIILISMNTLYGEWINIPSMEMDHNAHEIISKKTIWLNKEFFIFRAIFYFATWIWTVRLYTKWSLRQDETGDLKCRRKLKFIAGPATLAYGLTMSFAMFDWVMSMEPIWFSSIFGVIFLVEHGLFTLSFCILMVTWLSKYAPMNQVLDKNQLHNLGKLLFAFVILWGYINVSQFVIIWAANLPEENTWYINRSFGFFFGLTIFLLAFQFFVPFVSMLNRHIKRELPVIRLVAIWIIFMRVVDLMWLILPSRFPATTHNAMVEAGLRNDDLIELSFGTYGFGGIFLAVVGLGLIWLGCFFNNFRKHPILPIKDPVFSPHWNQPEEVQS